MLKLNNWHVFFLLLGATLIARFHTLFPPIIDHDETTYAVIADHMLNGNILYKDLIDIKQPGVFLVFALLQLLFGKSVLIIRLVAILGVSSAAYLLYLTKRGWGFDSTPSLCSAVIFILMFNFSFAFSVNTELFFIWCTCVGIYLFFAANKYYGYLLSGLVFGLGFVIKQHILLDFLAIVLFFVLTSTRAKSLKSQAYIVMVMTFGFAFPYLLVHLIYYRIGYYEHYHFVTYVASFNHSSGRNWGATFRFLMDGAITYRYFFALALFALLSKSWRSKSNLLVAILLVFDWLAICMTGKEFPHYYVQMIYPVAWVAGEFAAISWIKKVFSFRLVQLASVIIALFLSIYQVNAYRDKYLNREYVVDELIDFLEERIEGKTIYTGDAPQFLYWYFDKRSPTPYIHSTMMLYESHIKSFEINVKEELMRIYDTEPDLMILSENYKYKWFKELVERNYTKLEKIHQFEIYERR